MECFALSVAQRLIRRAQAEGISIRGCGRRLHLRAASPPVPELIEAIRVHKEEILEALRNDRQSLSIGCLKPPEPMRTCPGCHPSVHAPLVGRRMVLITPHGDREQGRGCRNLHIASLITPHGDRELHLRR